MGELIEHSEGESNNFIKINNSTAVISIKEYQNIYHQITGRTEKITQKYSENIKVEYAEIEQLHYKISQLCDIHRIIAKNETITIFHDKERKEQFTSFERFTKYNCNATSPTATVVIKYNFSIIPAGIQTPQEYVVTIKLSSRVAMLKIAENEAPPFMRGNIINFMSETTAEISIEYADYVIARGFIEAFDEWMKGCDKEQKNSALKFARKWSHLCSGFFQFIIALLIVYYAYTSIPIYFSSNLHPEVIARFIVTYIGALVLMVPIAGATGDIVERAIDTYPILSYLKLNKGDERLIAEFSGSRIGTTIAFFFGIIMTIAIGIITSKLEKLI